MRDLKRFFIPRFLAALLSVGIACPPAHLAIQPGRAAHALRPTQEGTGLEELRKTLTQNSAVLEPIFSRARREKISRVIFYVPSERLSWPLLDSWVILQRLEQNFPNARIEVYAPNTDLFKTVQLGSGVEIHSDLPAEDSNGDPGTVTIVAGINPLFIPNSGYVLHITSGGVFLYFNGLKRGQPEVSFSAGFYAAQARALQVLGFEGISLEGPPLLERKDLHPDVEALIKDLKEKHEAFSSGKPILFVNLLYGYGQWRRKKDTWLLILKKLLAQFPGYIVINEGPPSWNGQTLGHQEIVGVYEKLALVDDQKKLIRIGDIPNLENDLVRLFALMTLADVVLTEHSGVTHLADWMRKPLITSKNPQFSDYLLERPDSLDLQDVEADVPAAVQRLLAEAKPSGLEEAGWSFGPVSPVEEFKQRADKFRSAYIAAKSFMHRSSSGADLTTLLTAIETDIHNVLLDTGAPTYLASEAEEAIALYHLLKREPDRQRREGAAEGTSDKNLSVLLRRLAGKIDLIEDSFISSRFAETLDRRIETLPEDLKFKARKELTRLGANIQRARDFAHDRTELAEGWSPRGAAASFADIRQRLEEFYGETLTVEVGPFALEAILAMPSVRLFSLINNLVANAVGHTPGKEKVSLRLSMDPTTKELKIKVEDKGIGIPAEYFEETPDGMIRLFALEERGWRVPIGMAEVWDILAIADGRIAVETHHISKHPDNHGTTFTLWLPLSEAAPLTPSGAWLPLAPSAPEEAAGGLEEGIGVEAQAAEKLKEAVTAYAA